MPRPCRSRRRRSRAGSSDEPLPGPVSVAPAGDLRARARPAERHRSARSLGPRRRAGRRGRGRAGAWSCPVASAERVERRSNLAGEPRDTLVFERAEPQDARPAACDLPERGALTRAALIAGALTAMARLTVAYAGERRQFGRPIAAFQAVQQHLVAIAQDASLVGRRGRGRGARSRAFRDRRRKGGCLARGADRDARRAPGAWRDGDDPGVPAAPLQPPAVGVAKRVRR